MTWSKGKWKNKKGKNKIPNRWLDYKSMGKRIQGTRFVAFKVPLKQSFHCKVPASDAFGPREVLDALREDNQELGLIIDLTCTTRYYSLEDIPTSWCYQKIQTEGQAIPSDATILRFKRAVRRFTRDNRDNDRLIGVHCTHGVNRSGYLVCRYLIDVDGLEPKAALELFNSSRGHPVERENYLHDLQLGPHRSNAGMEECNESPIRGHCAGAGHPGSDPGENVDAAGVGARHQGETSPPSYRQCPPGGLLLSSHQWKPQDSPSTQSTDRHLTSSSCFPTPEPEEEKRRQKKKKKEKKKRKASAPPEPDQPSSSNPKNKIENDCFLN